MVMWPFVSMRNAENFPELVRESTTASFRLSVAPGAGNKLGPMLAHLFTTSFAMSTRASAVRFHAGGPCSCSPSRPYLCLLASHGYSRQRGPDGHQSGPRRVAGLCGGKIEEKPASGAFNAAGGPLFNIWLRYLGGSSSATRRRLQGYGFLALRLAAPHCRNNDVNFHEASIAATLLGLWAAPRSFTCPLELIPAKRIATPTSPPKPSLPMAPIQHPNPACRNGTIRLIWDMALQPIPPSWERLMGALGALVRQKPGPA